MSYSLQDSMTNCFRSHLNYDHCKNVISSYTVDLIRKMAFVLEIIVGFM
jgi:hypothetical protein